jgi:integrase
MSLRKRGSVWWIDFHAPNGERVRRSTETENKAQAKELHDTLKAETWRLQKLGERPKRYWEDAVLKFLKEVADKATYEDDKSKLRWLDPFLAGKELDHINRELIDRITDAKLTEGASNATVNRHLALVRTILRRCHRDWEWTDRAVSVRLLKEPTRRIRFLTQGQAAMLLRELPEHLKDIVTFALSTGLRAANITGMTWEQVDLPRKQAWVHPDQAKARGAIPVPFNEAALEVVIRQQGKHPVHVFTYEGSPVKQVSTRAWYKALKRAGITAFRFHDVRHTWASWHVQNGTPLHVLQELGGWETASMVRRYAHLAADHLAAYAGKVSMVATNDTGASVAVTNATGTNPSQQHSA